MEFPERISGLYHDRFWDFIDEGELRLQYCPNCDYWRYPPAAVCPECLAERGEWREVSGRGSVYSYVVFRRQYFDAYDPPYNVVSVELEEGVLLVSNFLEISPQAIEIGMPVVLEMDPVSEDLTLPRFVPQETL